MSEHNGTSHGGAVQESNGALDRHDDDDSRRDDQGHGNGHRPVRFPVDSQVVADPGGTRLMSEGHPAFPRPRKSERHPIRWIVIGAIVAAILFAGWYWGLPALRYELDTVSTDDAFVEGHITYASPRVEGLITEVMVDQDDRVEAGPAPGEARPRAVRGRRGAGRGVAGGGPGQRRAVAGPGPFADRPGACVLLPEEERPGGPAAPSRHSERPVRHPQEQAGELVELARNNLRRGQELVPSGGISKEEVDQRNNTLKVAIEQEKEAWAAIQETRAQPRTGPGLQGPAETPRGSGDPAVDRPVGRRQIASSLAEVGIPFDPKDAEQAKAFADFLRPDGDKSAGEGMEKVVDAGPGGQAWRGPPSTRAQKQLDDALLQLRWTEVRSEIAGYIQDRQANPGNRVEPGQTLLSIRPTYVWIAANYKETQIDDIRIGMPVDLYVDAYPHRVFHGRVAGFSPGTGLSESLLPPENATGNYVKVTQRLPVRIELTEPNPDDTPLFAGLSVVPHVRLKEQPTGPGAGAAAAYLRAAEARRRRRRAGRIAAEEPRPDRGAAPGHEHGIRQRSRRRGRAQGQGPGQSLDRRLHGHAGDLHGGARHLDRQRRVALHRRRALGRPEPGDLGADQLPRGQRDRAAALRLADGAVRPQAVLHDLRAAVHDQLGPLRRGAEHRAADLLPRPPGARRRRPPAFRAGHPGRYLSAPATGHGDGHVRRGRRRRADPRARAGRIYQRQLLLALDLLHQHPDRHRLADPDQLHRPGPAGDGRGGPEELEARPQYRLHRPGPGLDRAGLARGPLRQGPGMGLVRRPVLAGPDRSSSRW